MQNGVTLLEVMLVLAIMSSIVVLSIKMYQGFKLQQDLDQVQFNVDQLFSAMGAYYKANCQGSSATLDPNATAYLPPATSLSLLTPKHISNGTFTAVYTDLQNYGLPARLISTPLLDNQGNTYVLQFNPSLSVTPVQVNACVVMVPGTACTPTSSTLPAAQSLIWRAQVAVKLKDPTKGPAFKSSLGATCLSDGTTSLLVDPCSAPNPLAKYLVWERLPSFASPNSTSSLWISMPILNQFNLQYTHDQMYELSDTGAARPTYYLCGG